MKIDRNEALQRAIIQHVGPHARLLDAAKNVVDTMHDWMNSGDLKKAIDDLEKTIKTIVGE